MNPNLQRALLLYQQSRFELAEAELRQTLGAEPSDAYAHALLALCLARCEKFQEATDEARQAIHLQPDFPFAHYANAHVLYDRHHFPEARIAIAEAIRISPAEADYFSLLAGIELAESRWTEALAAAEEGLRHDPENVACTNLRAIAMVKLGRRAEAGATIDAALARNPESAITHANQGWTLLEKGQPKKALEHFREALRLDPENEWARQGTIEALKARHFIYAVMLKYFLWMARFSRRGQWVIVIGGYLGYRALGVLADAKPALAPWVLPLQILYICFALLTWMASPCFNLLLRLNKFGRLVLSREQTIASNLFGLCLLCALLCLGVYLFKGGPWIMGTVVFGLLLLPVSSIYRCASGWPRRAMAWLTIALALMGLAGLAVLFFASAQPGQPSKDQIGLGMALVLLSAVGCGASTWVSNILRSRQRRR